MYYISMDNDLIKEFSTQELKNFFESVIEVRIKQYEISTTNGIYFYLWFDWLAAQIRFNLITDFHPKLPFGRKIEVINEIDDIIKDF